MFSGTLYQGGREVMICTPWLKIGVDVGVINADGPFYISCRHCYVFYESQCNTTIPQLNYVPS